MTRAKNSNRAKVANWRTRVKVYKRDGGQCQYCAGEVTIAECNIDHVIPWRLGGITRPVNLVVACRICNEMKGSQLIPEELRPIPGKALVLRKERQRQLTKKGKKAGKIQRDRISVIRTASRMGVALDDIFGERELERWAD